ncbi:DUF4158 domain-containing protein [Streptomyces sp. NPDC058632]|uniref:DUF4158 domain-containing protein n=1 Tax=Streptomyces sp. NPDC058632 TaxID=3346567 RepID=UPI00365329DB
MRQDWDPEDLIEVWTLLEDDMRRVRNKSGATRLGFALLLRFSEMEARFPESAKEVPAAAVVYVAQQVKVPAEAWADYDWQSRAIQRHRGEIRAAYGFRANLERMKPPRHLTLLATLCHVRQTEITDSLVDLFIQLVLKINTRAERKVEKEPGAELKKVRGKEAMLLRVAEAALSEPSGTVRRVIFPAVGGEKTLKALAAEAAANEARYKARVRTVLRSSYSAHWRRMLSPLLRALELKCDNTAYRPVMDAIDPLKRYLEQPLKEGAFFDPAETVPLEGVVPEQWRAAAVDDKGRVERIPCELCVLVSLRDALRRREIRVAGANRWRNPEDDLPAGFESESATAPA